MQPEPFRLVPGAGERLEPEDRELVIDQLRKLTKVDEENLGEVMAAARLRRRIWLYLTSREHQVWPDHDPDVLVLQGGRGSGKTRSGAEIIWGWASNINSSRWAVVAPTFGACRSVCFEGESGLLSVIPQQMMWGGSIDKAYNSSRLELTLWNKSRIIGYSSEKPGNLRGPQHHGWWMDEPAEFRDSNQLPMALDSTFSNLILGARLTAPDPFKVRGVVTGTPKPCLLMAGDSENPGLLTGLELFETHINRMSSRDNLANLNNVYRKIIDSLEGTRIGRQEIEAELLTDIVGSLWKAGWILVDETALDPTHEWWNIVVGVDPAGSSRKGSDSTGIVVAGLDANGMYWVLEDLSDVYTPGEWANVVWDACQRWDAGKVVVERNYGGEMVEDTLLRHTECPSSMVQEVNASRGKLIRAEPVAILYEPTDAHPPGDRVRHAQHMPQLVDQLTRYTQKSSFSPDRLDAMVWALMYLSKFESDNVGADDYTDLFQSSAQWY